MCLFFSHRLLLEGICSYGVPALWKRNPNRLDKGISESLMNLLLSSAIEFDVPEFVSRIVVT
jgi:hypothetical protein